MYNNLVPCIQDGIEILLTLVDENSNRIEIELLRRVKEYIFLVKIVNNKYDVYKINTNN